MDNVYKVTELMLLRDPEIRRKLIAEGWDVPELENIVTNSQSVAKKGDVAITTRQCALVALAEYEYWRSQERTDDCISGMAAAANIYAAITFGQFAPWHPGYPKEEKNETGTAAHS